MFQSFKRLVSTSIVGGWVVPAALPHGAFVTSFRNCGIIKPLTWVRVRARTLFMVVGRPHTVCYSRRFLPMLVCVLKTLKHTWGLRWGSRGLI